MERLRAQVGLLAIAAVAATIAGVVLPATPALADAAPVVTQQPADVWTTEGGQATFSATADGTPTPDRSWERSTDGGTTWIAAGSGTWGPASDADNGMQWRAVFTNESGTVRSDPATLRIGSAPIIYNQFYIGNDEGWGPVGRALPVARFVSGVPQPTVQWYRLDGGSWTPVASSTVVIPATGSSARYYAEYTNPLGTATSQAFTVTSSGMTAIFDTQPRSQSVSAGATVSLAVTTHAIGSLTYQWQQSADDGATWTNIAGATTTSLSRTMQSSDDGLQVRVVATNSSGAATSEVATLRVGPPSAPVVTVSPGSIRVSAWGTAGFAAAATGSPVPTVTWQQSTNGGATWSTFSVSSDVSSTEGGVTKIGVYANATATTSDDGKLIRAVFTNSAGSATTAPATLHVTSLKPTISTQPVRPTIAVGSSVTLTAAAYGPPSPAAQWQRSTDGGTTWQNVTTAKSSSWTFTMASGDVGTKVRCVFSNLGGQVATDPVTLTVGALPSGLTVSPLNAAARTGQSVTFTASISSGTQPMSIQWYKSYDAGETKIPIDGATGTSVSVAGESDGQSIRISYTATNSQGTASSSSKSGGIAVFNIGTAPVITTQPQTASIPRASAGSVNATFTAAASGSPAPTYQWTSSPNGTSWTNITGATSPTLSVATDAAHLALRYRVTVKNLAGSVTSSPATIVLGDPPAIVTSPSDQSVIAGDPVTLTSAATGATSTRWDVSRDAGQTWNPVAGATSPSLTFTPTLSDDGARYRATYTNAFGTVSSDAARLQVSPPPTPPSAPDTPTATGGRGQATVTWSAPESSAPITGYVVTPYVAGVAQAPRLFGSGTTTHTVTGLSSGTSYAFTVAAVNVAGTGEASPPSAPVTVDSALTVTSPGPQSGWVAQPVQLPIVAVDDDPGATLAFSATGLPAGTTIDPVTGVISGTPATAKAYAPKVTVTDGASTSTISFTWTIRVGLQVVRPDKQITPAGVPVSLPISATDANPTAAITRYEATGLPPGLSIDAASGVVSGTPTTVATGRTVKIAVTDSAGAAVTVSFTWVVPNPVAITSPGDQETEAGASVGLAVAATGARPVALSYSATGLPAGLAIDPATGTISGRPTRSGTTTARVTASDGTYAATASFTWTVTARLAITNPGAQSGYVGLRVVLPLEVTGLAGGATPAWAATGLPAGLAIDPATGVISGTPTAPKASSTVTVTVSDGTVTATATFPWTVARSVSATRPAKQTTPAGLPTSLQIEAVEANPAATIARYDATGLPAGLHIDASTGLISGTPTSVASGVTVQVTVTDSIGASTSVLFTWVVTSPITIDPIPAQTSSVGTPVLLAPNATNLRGVPLTWSATGLPAGLTIDPATGAITGTPTRAKTSNTTIKASDGTYTTTVTISWTVTT